MISVAPASESDLDAIVALHAGGFEVSWSAAAFAELSASPGIFMLKAEEKGGAGVVGFVMARIVADEAEILTITVSDQMRGARIGQRLMEASGAEALAHGAATLFLEVAEDNQAALALYRRMGFAEIGRRPAYYERKTGKITALTMALRLT